MTSHLKCYLELARSGIVNDLKYDNPFITLTTVCNAFRGFILLDGIFHIFLMDCTHMLPPCNALTGVKARRWRVGDFES